MRTLSCETVKNFIGKSIVELLEHSRDGRCVVGTALHKDQRAGMNGRLAITLVGPRPTYNIASYEAVKSMVIK